MLTLEVASPCADDCLDRGAVAACLGRVAWPKVESIRRLNSSRCSGPNFSFAFPVAKSYPETLSLTAPEGVDALIASAVPQAAGSLRYYGSRLGGSRGKRTALREPKRRTMDRPSEWATEWVDLSSVATQELHRRQPMRAATGVASVEMSATRPHLSYTTCGAWVPSVPGPALRGAVRAGAPRRSIPILHCG